MILGGRATRAACARCWSSPRPWPSRTRASARWTSSEQADEAHRKFRDESSDFLGYLKLWDVLPGAPTHLRRASCASSARTNFLSFIRMREWHDVHQQLHALVAEMGLAAGRRQEIGALNDRPRRRRRRTGRQAAGAAAEPRISRLDRKSPTPPSPSAASRSHSTAARSPSGPPDRRRPRTGISRRTACPARCSTPLPATGSRRRTARRG